MSSFSVCTESTLGTHWNGPAYNCNADGSTGTQEVGYLGYVCGPSANNNNPSLCFAQFIVDGKKESILNFSFTKLGQNDPVSLVSWYASPSTGYFKGAENKIADISEEYNALVSPAVPTYTWTFTYTTKGFNPLA